VLLGHGPNKALLVPNSFGATDRNGNSIYYFQTIWQMFWIFFILQD